MAASFFFALYLQDIKLGAKDCQLSFGILGRKWFGIRGCYFGGEVRGLTGEDAENRPGSVYLFAATIFLKRLLRDARCGRLFQ